jgi:rhodanese-related sulfurtransferase
MPKNRVLVHQGRVMSSFSSISSEKLSRLLGTAKAPTVMDVRIDEDFAADPRLIPSAGRRSHRDIQDWGPRLTGQSVIVVCQEGKKLSEGTAAWLRHSGIGEVLARVCPLTPRGRHADEDVWHHRNAKCGRERV